MKTPVRLLSILLLGMLQVPASQRAHHRLGCLANGSRGRPLTSRGLLPPRVLRTSHLPKVVRIVKPRPS